MQHLEVSGAEQYIYIYIYIYVIRRLEVYPLSAESCPELAVSLVDVIYGTKCRQWFKKRTELCY